MERYAYLQHMHEQFKGGLLQIEPAVFRYAAERFPHRYGDYVRLRQFFDSLPFAADVSERFYTFQDVNSYSALIAPWIVAAMSGNKATRAAKLEQMFNSGKEISKHHLAGWGGAGWQIDTTDPVMAEAFRNCRIPNSRIQCAPGGVYKAQFPGCPGGARFVRGRELIEKFQGHWFVSRTVADAQRNDALLRLTEPAAIYCVNSPSAWI
jgi:hypothetical protein